MNKTSSSIITLFVFICLNYSVSAQNITISGQDSSYAGSVLKFYTRADLITNLEKKLGELTVGDDGSFHLELNINQETLIYTYTGIYKCYLFAEPNKDYHIILPEFREKKPEDIVNPYFSETELYIAFEGADKYDLQNNIIALEQTYEQLIVSDYVVKRGNTKKLDSIISTIDSAFADYDSKYFNIYKKYRWNALKNLAVQRNVYYAGKKHFLDKPIYYNNICYMDCFNTIFSNFFSFYSQTEEGKDIYDDIELSKSVSALKKTISKSIWLNNDTLMELIILKGLHDAFYPDHNGTQIIFKKEHLFQTLDSIKLNSKIEMHRIIAKNIDKKVRHLMKGSPAPNFSLKDIKGNLYTLEDFRGKYVYLSFFHIHSYQCRQEL